MKRTQLIAYAKVAEMEANLEDCISGNQLTGIGFSEYLAGINFID